MRQMQTTYLLQIERILLRRFLTSVSPLPLTVALGLQLDLGCKSHSLAEHLLLNHARLCILLLLQQSPGFHRLLGKVVDVRDKAHLINNALVVQKHTSNFSGGFAILLLDNLVDGVADFLTSVRRAHLLQPGRVDALKMLLLLVHHLLLHVLVLGLRGHLVHRNLRLLLLLLLLVLVLVALTVTTLSDAVLAISTSVVELASIAAVRSWATLTLEAAWALASVLIVLALPLELRVLAMHGRELVEVILEALQKVLLHFLEAALLTLLVKLLRGHPELN